MEIETIQKDAKNIREFFENTENMHYKVMFNSIFYNMGVLLDAHIYWHLLEEEENWVLTRILSDTVTELETVRKIVEQ